MSLTRDQIDDAMRREAYCNVKFQSSITGRESRLFLLTSFDMGHTNLAWLPDQQRFAIVHVDWEVDDIKVYH